MCLMWVRWVGGCPGFSNVTSDFASVSNQWLLECDSRGIWRRDAKKCLQLICMQSTWGRRGWTSKKACLINIQQRRPPRVLVMCLFIHPVQYKHFRATYTIHNSIIRQIWGLGNGRQLEEVVYKCKKYARPFMFVWNAHNFAFLFLMFLFLLVNHSDSTQSMRSLLARLAKKENHQSRDFTSFDITIMIKFALGLRFKKAVTKSS